MKSVIFALIFLAASASALELNPDNYDELTYGKTVLLKFMAPWCGHCKKLKPDWDKLIREYEGSATQLVADIDCTAEGKPLCEEYGVRGYPSIKYGNPHALDDYQGPRDLKSLRQFAEDKLRPTCTPYVLELCTEAQKAEINGYYAMSDAELDQQIENGETEIVAAEEEFKSFVVGLQEQYQEGRRRKEETLEGIREEGGLNFAKMVKYYKKGGTDEL